MGVGEIHIDNNQEAIALKAWLKTSTPKKCRNLSIPQRSENLLFGIKVDEIIVVVLNF